MQAGRTGPPSIRFCEENQAKATTVVGIVTTRLFLGCFLGSPAKYVSGRMNCKIEWHPLSNFTGALVSLDDGFDDTDSNGLSHVTV